MTRAAKKRNCLLLEKPPSEPCPTKKTNNQTIKRNSRKRVHQLMDKPPVEDSIVKRSPQSLFDLLSVKNLTEIFSNLNMSSLLNCRLVNKKWNSIIEKNVNIKGLTVRIGENENPKYNLMQKYYEFDFQPIDGDCIFANKKMEFFQSKIMQKILKNLKRLNICSNDEIHVKNSTLNMINQFNELEVLQIHEIKLEKPDVLKLPNLKTCLIKSSSGKKLTLKLPMLRNFKTEIFGFKEFKFLYQDQITHLSLDGDIKEDINTTISRYISKFKNLKAFYFKPSDEVSFPHNLLTILPSLEEFHCYSIRKDDAYELIQSKISLNRSNFKLFYCGFRICYLNDLDSFINGKDEYLVDLDTNTHIIALNYSKSSNYLPWIRRLNYDQLIQFFNGPINSNFFEKFVGIKTITVSEPINDKEIFAKFIRNCKNLSFLKLKNSSLPQSFFDQLPVLAPYLTHLRVDEQFKLNLEFFPKLSWLEHFSFFNQRVSFSIISDAIGNLKSLASFDFLFNNEPVTVYPNSLEIRNFSNEEIYFKKECEFLEFLKFNLFNN